MKLRVLRFVLHVAWTCEEYAHEFVEWAQQKYSDELHGIGRIS